MLLQQIMLASVVFLGAQMVCNRPPAPEDKRTADQVLGDISNPISGKPPSVEGQEWVKTQGTLAWANSTLNYVSASAINGVYQSKLDAEYKAKEKAIKDPLELKKLESEKELKKLQGDLLVADAQYKHALTRNDTNELRQAYGVLQGWERRTQGTEIWSQKLKLPKARIAPWRFPWSAGGSVSEGGPLVAAHALKPEALSEAKWVADVFGSYRFPTSLPEARGSAVSEISAKDLHDRLVSEVSTRNQNDLVYGLFPGFQMIDALVNLTGAVPGFSYAFAAFLLALVVRAIIFPLAQKQLMWGRKMQQLAPLVKEIREKYTDKKTNKVTDQAELQRLTMALYSEYGINPLAGCLPALIQFPLFITVYQCMLQYQFAFRNGTFLWINPATSTATHGFFAPNLGERDYVLIVIYGITMVISTLLMPASDPAQAKQQKLMGVGMGLLFTFFMFTGAFPTPAAFVLYWVFTNLLATAQSLRAYRLPMPPLEKVNTKAGGVFPMPPFTDPKPNGKANGTYKGPTSTGTPVKHKPKKRK
jgi:YidC/Oxa1 family membrane protein insertase